MAQEPDSLAFRFAVVLTLAVIVLMVTTWAAPRARLGKQNKDVK
jgi:hypothetical protein